MIGTNELHLNEATMKTIVQQWLDREMPKHGVSVSGVRQDSDSFFRVTLTEGKTL